MEMTDINKLRRLALDGDLAAMQAIVIHLEQVEKERDDLRAGASIVVPEKVAATGQTGRRGSQRRRRPSYESNRRRPNVSC